MKKKIARILAGVLVGMVVLAALIWLLCETLGNEYFSVLYAGKTPDYWRQQFYGHDAGASNAAFAILDSQIIPQLVDTMFHDTNDSTARMSLISVPTSTRSEDEARAARNTKSQTPSSIKAPNLKSQWLSFVPTFVATFVDSAIDKSRDPLCANVFSSPHLFSPCEDEDVPTPIRCCVPFCWPPWTPMGDDSSGNQR